jgi:hypothetical protein
LNRILAALGLDREGADIVRVYVEAFLTVVAPFRASVELVALDPGQTFKHSLSLSNLQSFEVLLSSSQKLPVIVESVSQADVDLVPIGQTLRKHLVGCCDFSDIDNFLMEADHEADAQEVEWIFASLTAGGVFLIEPLHRPMGIVSFPVLVDPNSLERI